jgi:L-galactono-1,4-lactone dehydrogenase
MGFGELRDRLLAHAPLEVAWVKRVNTAEAQFWRLCAGKRSDYSDRVLGFDCGGQQWVNEVALKANRPHNSSGTSNSTTTGAATAAGAVTATTGTTASSNNSCSLADGSCGRPTATTAATASDSAAVYADLDYMEALLALIESRAVPAPAPIEQRWTAASRAPMSPAYSESGEISSWVGIIMYLPTDEEQQRDAITQAFFQYRDLCKTELWDRCVFVCCSIAQFVIQKIVNLEHD